MSQSNVTKRVSTENKQETKDNKENIIHETIMYMFSFKK